MRSSVQSGRRLHSALAAVLALAVLVLTGPVIVHPLGAWFGGGAFSLASASR